MARYRKKKSRSSKRKIPFAATGAALAAGYQQIAYPLMHDNIQGAVSNITLMEAGKFNISRVQYFWGPVAAGVVISAAASKLGLNRYLSGIPIFKI